MSVIKTILSAIYNGLLKIQRVILVSTSLLVVGIICCAVFMRYVMHSDLFAYDEIVMIAAFWLYFIGASYGSHEDSHIKADIIQISLVDKHPAKAALVGLIARALEVVFSVSIAYWGWSLAAWQLRLMGRTMGWGIPLIVPQGAIVIGFFLMAFYAIDLFVRELIAFKNGTYKTSTEQRG